LGGLEFGPDGIETRVHNFFWGVPQKKPGASALSLGSLEEPTFGLASLAVGNMLKDVENRPEMAETGRDAQLSLRPFYKDYEKGCKFGPNGIETGVHKFFWWVLQPKPRAVQLV